VTLLPITLGVLVALAIGALFGFAAGRAHERERRFDTGLATGLAAAESLSGPRVPLADVRRSMLRVVPDEDRTPFQRVTDDLTGGCGCACHTGIGHRTSCEHCYRQVPSPYDWAEDAS
jgi:hypothetical protein